MKIIGHRGARGLAPENTVASLKKALEHHVDQIEFDLRVTKDNIVVLHHDAALKDPNGTQRLIKEHSFLELKNHKKDLTSFEEALQTIGKKMPLYIEVKPGEPTAPIIAIVRAQLKGGWPSKNLEFASFSQPVLLDLHTAFPDITCIVNENWSGMRATHRARQLNTRRISMDQRWLWKPFIQPMAKRGWQLSTFSLNDVAKARRWASYGLYGVITDYPDRFEG